MSKRPTPGEVAAARNALAEATNVAVPAGLTAAGLRYVSDDAPGIRRVLRGDHFSFRLPSGKPLRDKVEIARIRKLAIPPAYTDVWICPSPDGHLQATGRDARGRKQYRYHADWRIARDADKFDRMLEFGNALPKIRARIVRDLARNIGRHPPRESVLAAVVRLLDTTLVRIGNDEYARTNGSFGLTTLQQRHAKLSGTTLRLKFKGKSGIRHEVSLDDPRVARVIRRCQSIPGQALFHYEDEVGVVHGIDSADVNAYLQEASGEQFTAKDFRTWHATSHALALVAAVGADVERGGSARSIANEILAEVAARLGNTIAVCKKSYVHPDVLAMAQAGCVGESCVATRRQSGLTVAERNLLQMLAPAKPARPSGSAASKRPAVKKA